MILYERSCSVSPVCLWILNESFPWQCCIILFGAAIRPLVRLSIFYWNVCIWRLWLRSVIVGVNAGVLHRETLFVCCFFSPPPRDWRWMWGHTSTFLWQILVYNQGRAVTLKSVSEGHMKLWGFWSLINKCLISCVFYICRSETLFIMLQ